MHLCFACALPVTGITCILRRQQRPAISDIHRTSVVVSLLGVEVTQSLGTDTVNVSLLPAPGDR